MNYESPLFEEVEPGLHVLTLNRPALFNVLSMALAADIILAAPATSFTPATITVKYHSQERRLL